MVGDRQVVHTRLIPPRVPRRWLRRARLDQRLAEAADHALTVVYASPGYGKSSSLASFAVHGGWPTIWYSVEGDVNDPATFLLHLAQACRAASPKVHSGTVARLAAGQHGAAAWGEALDALVNDLLHALDDDTLLVLDNYHLADQHPHLRVLVDRLVAHRPPQLHIILATRAWPRLPGMPLLQAHGDLLAMTEHELAFTPAEVATLFADTYHEPLSDAQAAAVHVHTGGWALALQMLGHSLGEKPNAASGTQLHNDGSDALDRSSFILHPSSWDTLFTYLAHEVLDRQPRDVQQFLLRSSVLPDLDPQACDHVLGSTTTEAQLHALEQQGVFVRQVEHGRYRYHPLFHAFLQQQAQATVPNWAALHRAAAAYYQAQGAVQLALQHFVKIGDMAGAAQALAQAAQAWLDDGEYATLLQWLDQLPPDVRHAQPALLVAQGDAARLLDRFADALAAYQHAERVYAEQNDAVGQARALQAQALVCFATGDFLPADALLKRAFRVLPQSNAAEHAATLRLLAENQLNQGRASRAVRWLHGANRLHPLPAEDWHIIQARILLQQGRLVDARLALERQLQHIGEAQAPQSVLHERCTSALLLAFVCASEGDGAPALRWSQGGLEIAHKTGSASREAAAHVRVGHALQVGAEPDLLAAHHHYLEALALADKLHVLHTKAEAYMGLALLHGFSGDLLAAQAAGQEGLNLAERSGDAWTVALVHTALGALAVMDRAPDAAMWLHQALQYYERNNNTHGQALVQLWLAVQQQHGGHLNLARPFMDTTLALAQQQHYDGLLTRVTLFGPRDRMLLVPILLVGRADERWHDQAQGWLAQGFPAIAADEATQVEHPGTTLRIHLFGLLRVWRGTDEVVAREWTRRKAAHLLALLVANRHRWLLREQICDWLWPELSHADAEAQFKVTLNALNAVLEPNRPPRAQPFYIRRRHTSYRFMPPDGVWLDVDEFEARVAAAQRHIAAATDDDLRAAQGALTVAVGLYSGEYLSDYVYEEWTRNERERLAVRYLEAATMLGELFLHQHQLLEAIQLGEMILRRDPCWEDAYRMLMQAYAQGSNRRQALLTYERCVRHLRTQLGIAPLPQTDAVYASIKAGDGHDLGGAA